MLLLLYIVLFGRHWSLLEVVQVVVKLFSKLSHCKRGQEQRGLDEVV